METQGATGLLLSRTGAMKEAEAEVVVVVPGVVAKEVVLDVVEGVLTKVVGAIRTPPELEATIGRWRRWVEYKYTSVSTSIHIAYTHFVKFMRFSAYLKTGIECH